MSKRRIAVGLRKTQKNQARASLRPIKDPPSWLKAAKKTGLRAMAVMRGNSPLVVIVGKTDAVVQHVGKAVTAALSEKGRSSLPMGPRKQGMRASELQRAGKGIRKLRGKGKGRKAKPGIGRKPKAVAKKAKPAARKSPKKPAARRAKPPTRKQQANKPRRGKR